MATRPTKLKLLPRSTLQAKNVTRLVGQVVAGDGIEVVKQNGIWTISVDPDFYDPNNIQTGMATGSVLFADADGVLSQDNANLFWDDTNNRLGIGTATPDSTLNIVVPSNSQARALGITQVGTNATVAGTELSYNKIAVTGDASTVGSGGNADITFGLNVSMETGGGAAGSKVTSSAIMTHSTASAVSAGDHVAQNARMLLTAGCGGTNTGAGSSGSFFARGTQAFAFSGAHNLTAVLGDEIDFGLLGTATAKLVVGLNVVNQSTGSRGVSEDAHIVLSSLTGALGTKTGIKFGRMNGIAPVYSGGTLIASDGADTVANGIDWSSYTITGDFIKSANASIRGDGAATFKGVTSSDPANPNTFTRADSSSLDLRSGAAGSSTFLAIGRTGQETFYGVAATSSEFFPGTVAGDAMLKSLGDFYLGKGTSVGIKISTGGATDVTGTATNNNAASGIVGEYVATAGATNSNANATVTMTIAVPAVVTWTAHGFSVGAFTTALKFTTTGALPTGVTSGTTYYLKAIDANTFNIATSADNALAGTFITTTGSQSGVHTGDIRINMASTVRQNTAAMTLSAGDWDVGGQMLKAAGGGTTITFIAGNLTTTSAGLDRTFGRRLSFQYGGLAIGNNEFTVFDFAPARFSLASPTTIYLVAEDEFGVSTLITSG